MGNQPRFGRSGKIGWARLTDIWHFSEDISAPRTQISLPIAVLENNKAYILRINLWPLRWVKFGIITLSGSIIMSTKISGIEVDRNDSEIRNLVAIVRYMKVTLKMIKHEKQFVFRNLLQNLETTKLQRKHQQKDIKMNLKMVQRQRLVSKSEQLDHPRVFCLKCLTTKYINEWV